MSSPSVSSSISSRCTDDVGATAGVAIITPALPTPHALHIRIGAALAGFVALPLAALTVFHLWLAAGAAAGAVWNIVHDWLPIFGPIGTAVRYVVVAPVMLYVMFCSVTLMFVIIPNVGFSVLVGRYLGLTTMQTYVFAGFNLFLGLVGMAAADIYEV